MKPSRVSIVASALGATQPISPSLFYSLVNGRYSSGILPGIIATVSSGASLTYNVEITGDDIDAYGYNPANGNWNIFDNMDGLTASANGTLVAAVMAFRINVTAYTSGSVNLTIVSG
jgi:hypothetical protein